MPLTPTIVFMGSPDFAVPILARLAREYPIAGVVTQPDRPAGRGQILFPPPVKTEAIRLGIPVMQPEKLRTPGALDQLRVWAPDLLVVAAFGQILRSEVLDLPPLGCINVHASLLPRGRGPAPIQAAILAGDSETGITIMEMDPGVDTGPILSQQKISISPDDTGGTLFSKLSVLGADLLLETLPGFINGEIHPHPQPGTGITYAPMLRKEDGLLDFQMPAILLERRVRAMDPWPGAYIPWHGNPLKIIRSHVAEADPSNRLEAGQRTIIKGDPAIRATEGTLLVLDEVQPSGRKRMTGRAFLAGAHDW